MKFCFTVPCSLPEPWTFNLGLRRSVSQLGSGPRSMDLLPFFFNTGTPRAGCLFHSALDPQVQLLNQRDILLAAGCIVSLLQSQPPPPDSASPPDPLLPGSLIISDIIVRNTRNTPFSMHHCFLGDFPPFRYLLKLLWLEQKNSGFHFHGNPVLVCGQIWNLVSSNWWFNWNFQLCRLQIIN